MLTVGSLWKGRKRRVESAYVMRWSNCTSLSLEYFLNIFLLPDLVFFVVSCEHTHGVSTHHTMYTAEVRSFRHPPKRDSHDRTLPVSDPRWHLCTHWGYPDFSGPANQRTAPGHEARPCPRDMPHSPVTAISWVGVGRGKCCQRSALIHRPPTPNAKAYTSCATGVVV